MFLLRHWLSEPRWVALALIAIAASTVCDLLMPLYSGRLIDALASTVLSRGEAVHSALHAFAVIAGLSVVLVSSRRISLSGINSLTLRLISKFAQDTFWRIQRLSTEWHASNFAGATMRQITRGMWATDVLNKTLILALAPAFLVLVGSSLLLGSRWTMMGCFVGGTALLYIGLSVGLALRYVAPGYRLANLQDSNVGATMAEAISCNAVVKAFGAESLEEDRLRTAVGKWMRRAWRAWAKSANSGTIQLFVLFSLRMAVLLYTILLWWRKLATAGDIAFVLTSYFVVHGYLRESGQHIANLQAGLADMEGLVAFERLPLGVCDVPNAPPAKITRGEIVFKDITFRYPAKDEPLFRDLRLVIPPGQKVGLVGRSGAGKTTLIRLLHRLYEPTEGCILVDGVDIASVQQASLRSQIAIVPQEPVLLHRSLAENIAYGRPNASLKEIEAAARAANAENFILKQPKGYRTLVGDRGIKLSGGERQRIAIARAFLANSSVLILDEATSNLDSESEMLVQDAIQRLMVGRTCLVIAHRLSTIRNLDRILVLVDGQIVEDGRHEYLMNDNNGMYRHLFDLQAFGMSAELSGQP